MTKHEAAVISAYTGILLGDFSDMHHYVEQLLERPVWTHEFGLEDTMKEIKEKAKPDFVALEVT